VPIGIYLIDPRNNETVKELRIILFAQIINA
jgi:hypothetical protein